MSSTSVHAQKEYNTIIGDSLKVQSMQKIGLGMHVMSEEDNKTVLLSKSGRYVVKGTLTDMWDGVQVRDKIVSDYPFLPQQIDPKDYFIQYGNPQGQEVTVYLSYSCRQCELVIKQILSSSFIEKYRVNLLLVNNNQEDELVTSNVFCAVDKLKAVKEYFRDRNLQDLDKKCISTQAKSNVMLAMAQKVRSLPSTYVKGTNSLYLGELPSSIL
ncbi:hypothetical protein [Thalassotalea piscium]|uniref:Thiol:disulfide interchange protein DsbC n=1 Tax=Thalassotalea piscium TaxID=1230533 RepID=A0A7X0TTE7_9GAMM|nr:hypothetical protein [Thalassotalea piscium]MBB6543044.1 hypothetical protein [Thalassotalea piscium]